MRDKEKRSRDGPWIFSIENLLAIVFIKAPWSLSVGLSMKTSVHGDMKIKLSIKSIPHKCVKTSEAITARREIAQILTFYFITRKSYRLSRTTHVALQQQSVGVSDQSCEDLRHQDTRFFRFMPLQYRLSPSDCGNSLRRS